MREAVFKYRSLLLKWMNPHGLSTFLLLSVMIHLCFAVFLGWRHQESRAFRFKSDILQTQQVRLIGASNEDAPTNRLVDTASMLKQTDNSLEVKSELTAKDNFSPQESLHPSVPSSSVNPWFRNPNADLNQMQQIYMQQQRSFIYQQTTAQMQALLAQLVPDISEDVFCEDMDSELICTPVLAEPKLSLLKSIQQIARYQFHWQLNGNPLIIPTNGAKITLRF